MKDLVDYVAAFYKDESSNKPDIELINDKLQFLFFEYINKPFIILEVSTEYKLVKQTRKIRALLDQPSPSVTVVQSDAIR